MTFHAPKWYMDQWDEILNRQDKRSLVPDSNGAEHHRPPECAVDGQGKSLDVAGKPWDGYSNDVGVPVAGPSPVAVVPRWWYTTDAATLARITFLPDYAYQGDPIVVGMRTAWDGGEMDLCCDPATSEYFRKSVADTGTVFGKVFAPGPPPVGLWTGEQPQ